MKKWAIPSLVPFWYHLVPHHQTLPNLVYKLFKPFWTTISNCIFCLNEHRKTFISKGVDFRVLNDNATKWRTHLTYFIITALIRTLNNSFCLNFVYSGLPNKRTYVRSCSGKIFPLCTQLLGTLYAQCTVGFGAKMFQSRKLHQRWKIVLTRNVDYMPINKVSGYVC